MTLTAAQSSATTYCRSAMTSVKSAIDAFLQVDIDSSNAATVNGKLRELVGVATDLVTILGEMNQASAASAVSEDETSS